MGWSKEMRFYSRSVWGIVWQVLVTNHMECLGRTPIDFLRRLADITLTLMGGFFPHLQFLWGLTIICYREVHPSSPPGPSEVWTKAITLSRWLRRMKKKATLLTVFAFHIYQTRSAFASHPQRATHQLLQVYLDWITRLIIVLSFTITSKL